MQASVFGWGAHTAVAILSTEIKFKITSHDLFGNQRSRDRILQSAFDCSWLWWSLVEFLPYLLIYLEESEFGFVSLFVLIKTMFDWLNLVFQRLNNLTFSKSLSVDDNVFRQTFSILDISSDRFCNDRRQGRKQGVVFSSDIDFGVVLC